MCLCRISHKRAFTIAGPQVVYCTTVPLCQLTWKGFTKNSGECQLSNQGWRAVFVKNYYRAVPKEGFYKIFREWPPAIRFGICPPSWFPRFSPSRAKIHSPDSVSLSGFFADVARKQLCEICRTVLQKQCCSVRQKIELCNSGLTTFSMPVCQNHILFSTAIAP